MSVLVRPGELPCFEFRAYLSSHLIDERRSCRRTSEAFHVEAKVVRKHDNKIWTSRSTLLGRCRCQKTNVQKQQRGGELEKESAQGHRPFLIVLARFAVAVQKLSLGCRQSAELQDVRSTTRQCCRVPWIMIIDSTTNIARLFFTPRWTLVIWWL